MINVGTIFNEWTVLEYAGTNKYQKKQWKCRCSCGKEKLVLGAYLVNGKSKSCGHKDLTDIVDKVFNSWHVDSYAYKKNKHNYYNCTCVCGNKVVVSRENLLTGKSKSCGCDSSLFGTAINGIKVKGFSNGKYVFECPYCGKEFKTFLSRISSGHITSCGCKSKKFVDLTGRVFGDLTVLSFSSMFNTHSMWKCKCGCGTEKITYGYLLTSGVITSCGHGSISKGEQAVHDFVQELLMVKDIKDKVVNTYKAVKFLGIKNKKALWQWKCLVCGDIREGDLSRAKRFSCKELKKRQKIQSFVGNEFGDLVVESFAYVKDDKNYWNCRCGCGNVTCVTTDKLVNGNTKSCGCKRIKYGREHNRFRDITGQTFGNLTAIEHVDGKWLFQCNCGNKKIISLNDVVSGRTQSCGCLRHRRGKDSPRFQDIIGTRFGNLIAIEPMGGDNWLFFCTSCGKGKVMNLSNVKAGKCYSCGCMNTAVVGSKDELKVRDFIQSSGLEIKKSKILNGKEIDIYVPALKLGIEYNGSAFHASEGGVYNNKSRTYHQEKFIEAKKLGIHLISIFDFAWKNNQEKLRAYLTDLIVPPKKIFARKCELREVEKSIAKEFTDKYHLQGSARLQEINYGLYYDNELISVMSFGKPRYKQESNVYELQRYCVKSGYTILGGAERLFKHFIGDYSPLKIISYSDNNYFDGRIYPRLGFNFIKYTDPDYYWIRSSDLEVLPRYKCQPKLLKNKYPDLYEKAVGGKENFIMTHLGYFKVYGCGNTLWEVNFK